MKKIIVNIVIMLVFLLTSCGTNKVVKKDDKLSDQKKDQKLDPKDSKKDAKKEVKEDIKKEVVDDSIKDAGIKKEFSVMMSKYKLDKKDGTLSYVTYMDSLGEITDNYKKYPEVGFNIGSMAIKLSKFNEAYNSLLTTYNKSQYIPALINLSYVAYKLNRIKDVLPLLKKASLIEKIDADLREKLLANYSFILIINKNYEQALTVIREILSFKPRSILAYKNLGILYTNDKKFSLAEKVIDLSISYTKDKKEQSGLYVIKARYYKAKVNSVKMIAAYKKAISLDKLNVDANYALGLLYMKYGAGTKAVIYLKTLVENYPTNLLFKNLYAISLRMAKKYEKSYEIYSDLIKSESSYKDTYYNRGILLQKYMEKPGKAIEDYNKYKSMGGKKNVANRIKTCKQMIKDIEMIKAEEKKNSSN